MMTNDHLQKFRAVAARTLVSLRNNQPVTLQPGETIIAVFDTVEKLVTSELNRREKQSQNAGRPRQPDHTVSKTALRMRKLRKKWREQRQQTANAGV